MYAHFSVIRNNAAFQLLTVAESITLDIVNCREKKLDLPMLESKVEEKPVKFWNFKGTWVAFHHLNPMIMFDAFITARN